MKKILFLSVIVLFTLNVNTKAWSQESSETKVDSVMKIATLDVPTIKCGSCVETVTNALKEVKGVEEVTVSKKTKKAVIKYDPSKVNFVELELAVSKAGYNANGVKRDKKAYDQLDSCCK